MVRRDTHRGEATARDPGGAAKQRRQRLGTRAAFGSSVLGRTAFTRCLAAAARDPGGQVVRRDTPRGEATARDPGGTAKQPWQQSLGTAAFTRCLAAAARDPGGHAASSRAPWGRARRSAGTHPEEKQRPATNSKTATVAASWDALPSHAVWQRRHATCRGSWGRARWSAETHPATQAVLQNSHGSSVLERAAFRPCLAAAARDPGGHAASSRAPCRRARRSAETHPEEKQRPATNSKTATAAASWDAQPSHAVWQRQHATQADTLRPPAPHGGERGGPQRHTPGRSNGPDQGGAGKTAAASWDAQPSHAVQRQHATQADTLRPPALYGGERGGPQRHTARRSNGPRTTPKQLWQQRLGTHSLDTLSGSGSTRPRRTRCVLPRPIKASEVVRRDTPRGEATARDPGGAAKHLRQQRLGTRSLHTLSGSGSTRPRRTRCVLPRRMGASEAVRRDTPRGEATARDQLQNSYGSSVLGRTAFTRCLAAAARDPGGHAASSRAPWGRARWCAETHPRSNGPRPGQCCKTATAAAS